jgi:hypothetical protein
VENVIVSVPVVENNCQNFFQGHSFACYQNFYIAEKIAGIENGIEPLYSMFYSLCTGSGGFEACSEI